MKKISDIFFILSIIGVIAIQFLIRKFVWAGNTTDTNSFISDLFFNFLLGLILTGYYIKKYTPDTFRIILMITFLFELVVGIFLRKMKLAWGAEIMFIGFGGVLITWYYTHKNRHRFSKE